MPVGNVSVTVTFVAESGPALLTVTVNVTLSATSGAALLTVLAIERSATCADTATAAWSSSDATPFPGVESESA